MSEQIAIKTLPPAGAFTVFKTAKGLRWLAFSSNGYEDRDKEIVSTKALAADVARTAQDGKFGPLRWWHIGNPDPIDLETPWGDGIDLGWCDYSAMSGPFLVESGTFTDDRIGEAIARKARDLALSLGFFHPKNEPNVDGVFDHIRRFERSLAPAGKVSNPLTAFYVPGVPIVNAEQMTQLKALLGGAVPEAELQALIGRYTSQATKTAEAAGLRFKTSALGEQIAAIEAQLTALKHAAAKAVDVPDETEAEAALPEAVTGDDDEEEAEIYAGDMSIKDFEGMIEKAMTRAMGGIGAEMKALNTRLNMAEKMGAMMEEMKTAMTGTAQKDASRAQQIESLETTIKSLQGQLTELLGDAPSNVAAASTSPLTLAPVEGAETFSVTNKDKQPAYRNPADSIGAWVESALGA